MPWVRTASDIKIRVLVILKRKCMFVSLRKILIHKNILESLNTPKYN